MTSLRSPYNSCANFLAYDYRAVTRPRLLTMSQICIDPVITRPSPLPHFEKESKSSSPLYAARSFSRLEPTVPDSSIHRSQDMLPLGPSSGASTPEIVTSSIVNASEPVEGGISVKQGSEDHPKDRGSRAMPPSLPAGVAENFGSLPIELISLTDRLDAAQRYESMS